MESLSHDKDKGTAWELTQATFARLLNWLDDGRDSSGERYLEMRRRLQAWFDRKACLNAAALADETLNRVARQLDRTGEIEGVTPAQYCYITAKYVWLESLRQPRHVALEGPDVPQGVSAQPDARVREVRFVCLEGCLVRLTETERDLFRRYFIGQERTLIGQRQVLAIELGLSSNALSLRVFRLRARLEHCVAECLKRSE